MPHTKPITYTITDEAPALATQSFLPIVKAFAQTAGIPVRTADISLASRILSQFPDFLENDQIATDALAELGELTQTEKACIIKLPNISASVSQLKEAIAELQSKGYHLPNYPENAKSEGERDIKNRYDAVKGSAVNPVLREGNSDRRAPKAVKNYAQNNPHSMGDWQATSQTHVSSMANGDFYGSEKSINLNQATTVSIRLKADDGSSTTLLENLDLQAREIIDTAVLQENALRQFLRQAYREAKEEGVLFSVHLKATMMKVSDPIIFGHVVKVFFAPLFEKHGAYLKSLGANPNNGFASILAAIDHADDELKKAEMEQTIAQCYAEGPDLAQVNSAKGITNLHYPNDVIIDASMPAMIRNGGQMWNAKDEPQDAKAIIPDRCYAAIYQETIDFCKTNGAFNPATMGSVSNVGLMAQKAEEYGSHNKTFEASHAGVIEVVNAEGTVLMAQKVAPGDIFRMCQTKAAPVENWIKLALQRAKEAQEPAVFWLDENRAHDAELIKIIQPYLAKAKNLDLKIMSPAEATRYTLQRCKAGKNTISVTGNVLRDFLTDLFPILELGTSAKMLSIVPLMKGGGLFETGAGGSAPKHVQQFLAEGHLRWDSLGEFLALEMALRHLGNNFDNPKAIYLADALEEATNVFLAENKGPKRKVHQPDNRNSHFYLAMYWAKALAKQNSSPSLKAHFSPLAKNLEKNEGLINSELMAAQGKPVVLKGYYKPSLKRMKLAMRPSATLNAIIG